MQVGFHSQFQRFIFFLQCRNCIPDSLHVDHFALPPATWAPGPTMALAKLPVTLSATPLPSLSAGGIVTAERR